MSGLIRPFHGNKFTDQQFDTYKSVWLSLNRLRKAGDALWQAANETNLIAYSSALQETIELVNNNGIFFHPKDYEQLQTLLDTFANFSIGKERLIDMRRQSQIDDYFIKGINMQIRQNKDRMIAYSTLLDHIRETYHDRLSWTKAA